MIPGKPSAFKRLVSIFGGILLLSAILMGITGCNDEGNATGVTLDGFLVRHSDYAEGTVFTAGDTMVVAAHFIYGGTNGQSYDLQIFLDDAVIYTDTLMFYDDADTQSVSTEYLITPDMQPGTHEVRIGTVTKTFTVTAAGSASSGSGLTAGTTTPTTATPTTSAPTTSAPTTLPSATPTVNNPPDLNGMWSFNIKVTEANGDCAGEAGDSSTDNIRITQNGQDIVMAGFLGVMSNTLSGNINYESGQWVINVSGSYPEEGGTTTTSHRLIVNNDSSLSGTESWEWAGGGESCPGGKASVSATR